MNLIIDGFYGVFIIENLTTTLTLKIKEIGLFGYNKRRITLAENDLGKKFFKEEVWVEILSV